MNKTTYFKHHCDLPKSSESCLLELPPYLPKYMEWFRMFRKWFIVDEKNRRTRQFFRSYAAVMAEKRRHAQGPYAMIIHPFSRFAIYKERFVCILWLISFYINPYLIAFYPVLEDAGTVIIVETVLDTLLGINIALTCITGYYVLATKEVVIEPKHVLKNYAKGYMLLDIIGCFPCQYCVTGVMEHDPLTSRVPYINVINCATLTRLPTMLRYLSSIFEALNISEAIYTCFSVFLMTTYVIHWWACILYGAPLLVYTIDKLPNDSWINKPFYHPMSRNTSFEPFITAVVTATCHFYGASEGTQQVRLILEELLCSFILLSGCIYCSYIMAKVLEIFGSANISESKYEELLYQLTEYVKSKNLPDSLKKRLVLYYEYKFQKRFFKEEEILSTLSEHLRFEVFLYSCRILLEKVAVFQGLTKGIIGSIVGYLKKEIFLTNDVVLKVGEPLTKMFYISYGTVAVYYGNDCIEILHFEDGDHFGDKSILRDLHTANLTLVALEITEIFTLNRKDVKHCSVFLREMALSVNKISKEKNLLYANMAKMMAGEGSTNRILADLRKGRILERDRWRNRIR